MPPGRHDTVPKEFSIFVQGGFAFGRYCNRSYQPQPTAPKPLPDAPAYMEWLDVKRLACHRQVLSLSEQLTRHYAAAGSPSRQIALARAQTQIDPWNEAFHLRILAIADNRWRSQIVADLRKVMKLNRHHSLFRQGRLDESLAEHRALMSALKRRDAPAAAALCERHFRRGLAAAVPPSRATGGPRAPRRRTAA